MDVSIYQGEAQIYIRGIGYTGLIGGTDSSTAFHLNGVYLSRSAGAIPGFFDVERVEVLRGPQGTLYGRNATGGSVNVISKGPTAQFASEAELTVGNYNHYRVLGALGGPLGSESVAARLAVQVEDRDGYTDATRPDGTRDDIEDQRDITARLSVRLEPTENFDDRPDRRLLRGRRCWLCLAVLRPRRCHQSVPAPVHRCARRSRAARALARHRLGCRRVQPAEDLGRVGQADLDARRLHVQLAERAIA